MLTLAKQDSAAVLIYAYTTLSNEQMHLLMI